MNERYGQNPRFLFCHDNPARPISVIFFSGLGSTIERQHVEEYRTFCHLNDVSFLALDFTAHAYMHQRTEPDDFGMNHRLNDALNILKDEIKNKPFVLVGFSMGGKLALDVAQKLKSQTQALIELAPAIELEQYRWYDNLNLMVRQKLDLLQKNEQKRNALESLYVFSKMLKAVKPHLLLKQPVTYDKRMEIIHGILDKHVPYRNSLMFKKDYAPHAKVALLTNETHHFLQPCSRQIVFNTLSDTLCMVRGR